jgi:hypothetical protein
MKAKKIISITAGLALAASMALAVPAFAQTTNGNQGQGGQHMGTWNGTARTLPGAPGRGSGAPSAMRPGVFGTVTAVNGDIITINGRQGFSSTTPTISYTVDATNATVKKNNATSTVSSIVVGDTIFAQGAVTGTNVVATTIRDGIMTGTRGKGGPGINGNGGQGHATSTPPVSPFLGNGQPVIAGTISSINGASLTVTTTSNVTYTVDASNAKIVEGQNTIALSSIIVGNKVLIQGAVNGTSITASTVIDQSAPAAGTSPTPGKIQSRGFFGSIGSFFSHLFGF